ncbi:MAG: glutamine synthetase family protein [Bacteroides sp.]|mgnify:FL=1
MQKYTKEDIFNLVEDEDVEFIRLQFTDLFGNLKNIAITVSQLEKALDNKIYFNPASIDGYVKDEDDVLFLHPDLSTFVIFPWRPQQGKVARMICDVYRQDGTPYEGDSRYILKQAVEEAGRKGYTFDVRTECEFFLFQTDENGLPTTVTYEQAGYLDLAPIDMGENARRDIIMTLEQMGFEIESSHHEDAPAQHEIDFMNDEAVAAADNMNTFKLAVKSIAKSHGLHATFMPKPKQGVSGSGMNIKMSLKKDGKSIFEPVNDNGELSKEAMWFIGGLLKHVRSMAPVTNPLVNSYKRLVPGFEAPVQIGFGSHSRSVMVYLPHIVGEKARLEFRSPDPAANPYLTLSLCLQAGLKGIEEHTEPDMDAKADMPDNLWEAIRSMEEDAFVEKVLGSKVNKRYLELKKAEWNRYRVQVSEWEINEYLYRF